MRRKRENRFFIYALCDARMRYMSGLYTASMCDSRVLNTRIRETLCIWPFQWILTVLPKYRSYIQYGPRRHIGKPMQNYLRGARSLNRVKLWNHWVTSEAYVTQNTFYKHIILQTSQRSRGPYNIFGRKIGGMVAAPPLNLLAQCSVFSPDAVCKPITVIYLARVVLSATD